MDIQECKINMVLLAGVCVVMVLWAILFVSPHQEGVFQVASCASAQPNHVDPEEAWSLCLQAEK